LSGHGRAGTVQLGVRYRPGRRVCAVEGGSNGEALKAVPVVAANANVKHMWPWQQILMFLHAHRRSARGKDPVLVHAAAARVVGGVDRWAVKREEVEEENEEMEDEMGDTGEGLGT
jgi:hypothetical protein